MHVKKTKKSDSCTPGGRPCSPNHRGEVCYVQSPDAAVSLSERRTARSRLSAGGATENRRRRHLLSRLRRSNPRDPTFSRTSYRRVDLVCSGNGWPGGDGATACPQQSTGTGFYPLGSSYGSNVDFWAPAHNVDSAHSDGFYRPAGSRSGTSFAAPLVAGVVARIMQVEGHLSPSATKQRLEWSAVDVYDPQVPGSNIDPVNFNSKVVHRDAATTCSPEYP